MCGNGYLMVSRNTRNNPMGKIIQRVRNGSPENRWTLSDYSPSKRRTIEESSGLKATPSNYQKAEKILRDRETSKDNLEEVTPKSKKCTVAELLENQIRFLQNNRK